MNRFLAICLALITVFGCHLYAKNLVQNQPNVQQPPKGFSYPESPETIQINVPYEAKSLAGRVVDSNGATIEKALVELLDEGWGKRLDAVFSDSNGWFSFPRASGKTVYIKLSNPGFSTSLIKLRIQKRVGSELTIKLVPSK